MDIPPNIQIRSTIKPGSVYYFPEETFRSSDPHYFIVINNDPLTDTIVFLVWASSQIKKVKDRRKTCPPETLVEISPTQYSGFPKHSIIDCNDYREKQIDHIVEKLEKGNLKLKPEMDEALIKILREGVIASPLIPMRIKLSLKK